MRIHMLPFYDTFTHKKENVVSVSDDNDNLVFGPEVIMDLSDISYSGNIDHSKNNKEKNNYPIIYDNKISNHLIHDSENMNFVGLYKNL